MPVELNDGPVEVVVSVYCVSLSEPFALTVSVIA